MHRKYEKYRKNRKNIYNELYICIYIYKVYKIKFTLNTLKNKIE